MLGRINHIAIAVPDVAVASATYRDTLGAKVSAPQSLPEHGVIVVFIELPNTKVMASRRSALTASRCFSCIPRTSSGLSLNSSSAQLLKSERI
jgi:catechol 2,3-dioxygenase-like lactoylglutathione lyase family enzyme